MNLQTLPDSALLRVAEIVRPAGPVPFRRSKWLALVKAGDAPAPAVAGHRLTAWRWGDVRVWLENFGEVPR